MWFILLAVISWITIALGSTNYTFPSHFLFGLSTSSYQVEGAWNEDGKSVNIMDTLTHQHPEFIKDRSNGDVAADSYHLYKEDVKLLKQVGVDFYRFSISWSRILPTGYVDRINQAGINHYNNLINELLNNGIEPLVTILHWDIPQSLQDIGGATNPEFVDILCNYAEVLFKNFGDRVKWWTTFNEPAIGALQYGSVLPGFKPPGVNVTGIGNYLASHNMLLGHCKIYHLYDKKFRPHQKGKISISLNNYWYEPYSNSKKDVAAVERVNQFILGLFAHPIFSKEGDYPALVKERVEKNSLAEGFSESRLPRFTKEEIQLLKGSADFFAINHYTTYLIKDGEPGVIPSFERDMGAVFTHDPNWESTNFPINKVVPWGFRKLLVWIAKEYNNPPIFVTENGYADQGQLNDIGRINYIMKYTKEMLKAMNEYNVNVIGYTLWSFLDNFEWLNGYTQKFGIFHVDFNDTARKRTEKDSAKVFAEMVKIRAIPPRYH